MHWTRRTSCPTMCVVHQGPQELIVSSPGNDERPSCRRCLLRCTGLLRCIDWLAAHLFMCTRQIVAFLSSSSIGNLIHVLCEYVRDDLFAGDFLLLQFSISYCVLQLQLLRVHVARLSDATLVDNSQSCTCVCSEHVCVCPM